MTDDPIAVEETGGPEGQPPATTGQLCGIDQFDVTTIKANAVFQDDQGQGPYVQLLMYVGPEDGPHTLKTVKMDPKFALLVGENMVKVARMTQSGIVPAAAGQPVDKLAEQAAARDRALRGLKQ